MLSVSSAPSRAVGLDERGRFVLSFPYSHEMVEALKASIPLAMWDRAGKFWHVQVGSWREVVTFAKQCGFTVGASALARIEQAKQTQAASRAVSVDVDIPAPEGLSYMPFQRAGIVFALNVFGDL